MKRNKRKTRLNIFWSLEYSSSGRVREKKTLSSSRTQHLIFAYFFTFLLGKWRAPFFRYSPCFVRARERTLVPPLTEKYVFFAIGLLSTAKNSLPPSFHRFTFEVSKNVIDEENIYRIFSFEFSRPRSVNDTEKYVFFAFDRKEFPPSFHRFTFKVSKGVIDEEIIYRIFSFEFSPVNGFLFLRIKYWFNSQPARESIDFRGKAQPYFTTSRIIVCLAGWSKAGWQRLSRNVARCNRIRAPYLTARVTRYFPRQLDLFPNRMQILCKLFRVGKQRFSETTLHEVSIEKYS